MPLSLSKLGPVEILVCNAGITKDNLLMRMKDEDWNDVITADLSSLFYCADVGGTPPDAQGKVGQDNRDKLRYARR